MNKKRWIIATGAGLWVAALLGYFAVMRVSSSLVSGSINGLEVMGQAASRGGAALFVSDGITATIHLGKQMALITSKEIELPGGRTVDIPTTCKKVRLFETRNDIRVLFDGGQRK